MPDIKEEVDAKITYMYIFTNDLDKSRHFYTELIGLNESDFSEKWGDVCYKVGDCTLLITRWDRQNLETNEKWDYQPGTRVGEGTNMSCSIEMSEDKFRNTYNKLKAAQVKKLNETPTWQNYWSFTVKDPMGYTVELVYQPKEKPLSEEWKN